MGITIFSRKLGRPQMTRHASWAGSYKKGDSRSRRPPAFLVEPQPLPAFKKCSKLLAWSSLMGVSRVFD